MDIEVWMPADPSTGAARLPLGRVLRAQSADDGAVATDSGEGGTGTEGGGDTSTDGGGSGDGEGGEPSTSTGVDGSGDGGNADTITTNQLFNAVAALVIAYVLGRAARRAIRRIADKTEATTTASQISSQLAFWVIMAVGISAALTFLGVNLGPLLAGAGVASVVLGFALKDTAENYMSGIIIGFSRPFGPGDRVIIEEYHLDGIVEQLELRYTVLRTGDGVRLLVPNSVMIKSPLLNEMVNGKRRSEFEVGVGFGTDLEEAIELARSTVAKAEGVSGEHEVDAFVASLDSSWVTIRVRFWHEAPRHVEHEVTSRAIIALFNAFNDANIEMPLRNQVVQLDGQIKNLTLDAADADAADAPDSNERASDRA